MNRIKEEIPEAGGYTTNILFSTLGASSSRKRARQSPLKSNDNVMDNEQEEEEVQVILIKRGRTVAADSNNMFQDENKFVLQETLSARSHGHGRTQGYGNDDNGLHTSSVAAAASSSRHRTALKSLLRVRQSPLKSSNNVMGNEQEEEEVQVIQIKRNRGRTVAADSNNMFQDENKLVLPETLSARTHGHGRTQGYGNDDNGLHTSNVAATASSSRHTTALNSLLNVLGSEREWKPTRTAEKPRNETVRLVPQDVSSPQRGKARLERRRRTRQRTTKAQLQGIVYDCKIEGDEQIFDVCRQILSAKSQGFKILFEANDDDLIELEGIPDKTLEIAFRFCHGYALKECSYEALFSVLFFADVWEIPELKLKVEERLLAKLSSLNVVKICNKTISTSETLQKACKELMLDLFCSYQKITCINYLMPQIQNELNQSLIASRRVRSRTTAA